MFSASAIAIVVANTTSASTSTISTQPHLPALPPLPLQDPLPSGWEVPAEDRGSGRHGQVMWGEMLKKSLLVHILLISLTA